MKAEAERDAARDNSIADCVKAVAAKKASRPIWSADAPLTPADAMARCPEVAALVGAIAETAGRLQRVDNNTRNLPPEMEGLSAYECGELAAYLDRVFFPFTKGSDG